MVVFVTGYSPSSHQLLLQLGVHAMSVCVLEANQQAQRMARLAPPRRGPRLGLCSVKTQ